MGTSSRPILSGILNLDTHIIIHALDGSLRPAEHSLLRNNSWSISAIVLWELAKLSQLKRITLDLGSPEFTRVMSRVQIWPLNLRVCREIMNLDFQSDPADEIIAATSIVQGVPLLTRDNKILKSKLVPLAK